MRKLILAVVLLLLVPMQAMALSTDDLLALVAMPLAVAAVAELTGVPESDLASLAATLNNADVPPVQFVEVIRYVPVALVADDLRPEFVQFVQTQANDGIQGTALVNVIKQRLRTIEPALVMQPRPASQIIIVDNTFIPAVVRTRAEKRRSHPHGGPPGQLKKERGLKTGAEVVHGSRPMVSSSGDRDDDKNKGRGKSKDDHGKGKGKGKGKG